ncbi:MAG: tRNA 5-methoxyuridine(34)/uridine 5-oxyacetic acid(34) synthase CmoB [Bdellovibrionales bacterium]|nr:tRNA 5-methoxyuridine(34)/uridine 5-oxyacetic acid(34) synthase CmoB [Bdellovibrionales bacterium]
MLPEHFKSLLPYKEIAALRELQEVELIRISHWDKYRKLLAEFRAPAREEVRIEDGPSFEVRASDAFEKDNAQLIQALVEGLIPWRKGPFSFLGYEIDAEWRSNLKWDRIAPHLPEMRNRRVGDVGSNNGYYLFRMLKYDPALLLGLDPSSRCFYQFDLFQRVIQDERLAFELFGIEHLHLFPEFFDVLFCLGVIYHRRDPYSSCRMLFDALRTNGTLFFESLVVPGDEPMALCPVDRYAKMRNVWYVPTVSCMKIWLQKAGFEDVEELSTVVVTTEEQRQTRLAPYESLADFLNPNDPTRTIEEYPAPTRTILKATKRL